MTDAVIGAHDGAMFDLDGVVYRFPVVVPGAVETLTELRARDVGVGFITNNAAREPQEICADLVGMGVTAERVDVLTSAQAVATLMASQLAPGSPVLVVGAASLAREIAAVGLRPVARNQDRPVAIVQGYDPELSWPQVAQGCLALADGAAWYASNLDVLRPTAEGMLPGAGAQVAALHACFPDREPQVGGKPYPPLFTQTAARLGASRPVVVGDRLDTDIQGASNAEMASMFVLTGTHGKADLVAASPGQRPTYLGVDLSDLLRPARAAVPEPEPRGSVWHCREAAAAIVADGTVRLDGPLGDVSQQADALWALAQACWNATGATPDATEALGRLDLLG